MHLVEGVQLQARIVDEDGEVKEIESKDQLRASLMNKFEEMNEEEEENSIYDFIYGSTSTDDIDSLDSNRVQAKIEYGWEELKSLIWHWFVTGQAKFEDLQMSDSDDEKMKEAEQYRNEKLGTTEEEDAEDREVKSKIEKQK